jgi:hypothetical protein
MQVVVVQVDHFLVQVESAEVVEGVMLELLDKMVPLELQILVAGVVLVEEVELRIHMEVEEMVDLVLLYWRFHLDNFK